MTYAVGRRRVGTQVYINVYDLAPANEVLHHMGLGMYHTGVEIMGSEYTFAGGSGVFSHTPRMAPNAKFRLQVDVGSFDGGMAELKSAVDSLSDERFGPDDYNILRNNCNHFADALCRKLVQRKIPAYINRAADIGACCSWLFPKEMLKGAPVSEQNEESTSFLVKAPMSRSNTAATNTSSTTSFAGSGARLGGSAETAEKRDSLTDRREKARMAALARLDQQQQNDSDKSQ